MRIAWLSLFWAVLLRAPLKSLSIAWWWLARRRVRAVGRLRETAANLPDTYRWWRILHRSRYEDTWQFSCPDKLQPHITVHLHLSADCDTLQARKACMSVYRQSYAGWSLLVTSAMPVAGLPKAPWISRIPGTFSSRAAALKQVFLTAKGDYVVPLSADSVLNRGALHAFAAAIADLPETHENSSLPILYADQDEFGENGCVRNPWFKPNWDPDLFIAQDFISAACAIPRQRAVTARIPPNTDDKSAISCLLADLLIAEPLPQPQHVPYVATTTTADTWCKTISGRAAVLGNRLPALLIEPGPFGTLACRRPLLIPPPKVNIIIPTRDRIDLLKPCVESILSKTTYPNFEILIVDNDSKLSETISFFHSLRENKKVKVLHWPKPYNYSAINNFAVSHADGEYICLLNNDTEVIADEWLNIMMTQAIRPEIGAVGARLLYPDRSIQHAGVVIGLGGAAGHAHRGLPEDAPGYFAQALVPRQATAVTAACLVVSKISFQAVGGLDEENLAIAYNDVDLCLKLRATGLSNFYDPRAVLYHYESKSRGLDFAPEHLARYMRELGVFQKRWNTVGYTDPTHHPHLDPASEVYRLRL